MEETGHNGLNVADWLVAETMAACIEDDAVSCKAYRESDGYMLEIETFVGCGDGTRDHDYDYVGYIDLRGRDMGDASAWVAAATELEEGYDVDEELRLNLGGQGAPSAAMMLDQLNHVKNTVLPGVREKVARYAPDCVSSMASAETKEELEDLCAIAQSDLCLDLLPSALGVGDVLDIVAEWHQDRIDDMLRCGEVEPGVAEAFMRQVGRETASIREEVGYRAARRSLASSLKVDPIRLMALHAAAEAISETHDDAMTQTTSHHAKPRAR